MDYGKIGANIRNIRETELKQTREEFAERIGISPITIARLENATSRVTNVETFFKISEISGYTIEELLLEKNDIKNKKKIRRKIDYILNVLSDDELKYVYKYIQEFTRFIHKDQVNTLKDIKKKYKAD